MLKFDVSTRFDAFLIFIFLVNAVSAVKPFRALILALFFLSFYRASFPKKSSSKFKLAHLSFLAVFYNKFY